VFSLHCGKALSFTIAVDYEVVVCSVGSPGLAPAGREGAVIPSLSLVLAPSHHSYPATRPLARVAKHAGDMSADDEQNPCAKTAGAPQPVKAGMDKTDRTTPGRREGTAMPGSSYEVEAGCAGSCLVPRLGDRKGRVRGEDFLSAVIVNPAREVT
jgi:hypothetical protein